MRKIPFNYTILKTVNSKVEVNEETYQAWLNDEDPNDLLGETLERLENELDSGDYKSESVTILDKKGNTLLSW